jgi:hypothetical protein
LPRAEPSTDVCSTAVFGGDPDISQRPSRGPSLTPFQTSRSWVIAAWPATAPLDTATLPVFFASVDEGGPSGACFSFGALADFGGEGAFDVVAFGLGEAAKFFEGAIEASPEDASCLEGVFVVLMETKDVEGTFVFMADDFSVAD